MASCWNCGGNPTDCNCDGSLGREAEELRAEVAALRQQLDAARDRWQQMRTELAIPDDWEPYIEPEEARIAAYVKIKASDAEHQRGKQRALVDLLAAAEADRDRLLVVYRAAEAWRDWWATLRPEGGMFAPENGLAAAVDRARRAGTPAEPAPLDTWTSGDDVLTIALDNTEAVFVPAKDGDTPGELVPGEGEQQQPMWCGTDCIEPRHEPNWNQDFLDFPTAWWIQEQGFGHTDERCSAVQSNGALLCDCGAVEADWKRLRDEKRGVPVDTEEAERGQA